MHQAGRGASSPRPEAARQQPFARVAPMLAAALLTGVGGGFALAALLSVTRALRAADGVWWLAVVQAHGHLQLYGWAGLFALGVAFHFLPRLRGAPLAHAGLVPWLLGGLLAALGLRALGQPLAALTGAGVWRGALVGSGALECAALVGAVALLAATARAGPPLSGRTALRGVLPCLACAFAALGLEAVANLVNVIRAAGAPGGLVPPAGDALDVTLGLLGYLVPLALAMSARALPMYAGLDAFPRGALWPAAGAYAGGVALAAAGAAGGMHAGAWSGLAYGAGTFVVGAVLVAYVATFVRLMRARGRLPRRVEELAPAPAVVAGRYRARVRAERGAFGPFVALVASAYGWALLSGALLALDGAATALGRTPPVDPDAARHGLALGFVALLICGVAPRMVPGFSGGHIASPRLVHATLWLGNGAALLRVGALLAAPGLAALGPAGVAADAAAFGLSGPLGLALAICLAVNLWPALWPGRGR